MTKQRLIHSIKLEGTLPYSVNLSLETPAAPFTSDINSLVRYRIRFSKNITYLSKRWRIDLTAVRSFSMNELSEMGKPGSKMSEMRDHIFKDLYSELVNKSDSSNTAEFEFEAEIELIDTSPIQFADFGVISELWLLTETTNSSDFAYAAEISKLSAMFGIKNKPNAQIKNITPNVIALTKPLYYSSVYPCKDYCLTIKADGVHCLCVINGNRCRVLTNKIEYEFIDKASGGSRSESKDSTARPEVSYFEEGEETIVDCEMIAEDTKDVKIYIFDVLKINGKAIIDEPFSERGKYLKEAAALLNTFVVKALGKKSGAFSKDYFKVKAESKNESKTESTHDKRVISSLEKSLKHIKNAKYPFETDGIIFVESNEPYLQTKSYKWKPVENNTIDFLCKAITKGQAAEIGVKIEPKHTIYILFCGIDIDMYKKLGYTQLPIYDQLFPNIKAQYIPTHYVSTYNKNTYYVSIAEKEHLNLNNQICEFRWDDVASRWIYVRTRKDKEGLADYYGNDYRIADLTFTNYIDVFKFEDLYTKNSGYFDTTTSRGDIYYIANKYQRMVINELFTKYMRNAAYVIDLAAGRGADLQRYINNNVANLLCIDIDSTAIAELVRRKFSIGMNKTLNYRESTNGCAVSALVADITEDWRKIRAKMNDLCDMRANTIVCNFAFHYFCATEKSIRNVLQLVSESIASNGNFILTVFDGEKVFEKLAKTDNYILTEDSKTKYKITKKYKSKTLDNCGQQISVLLSFSQTESIEYLVNIDYIKDVASDFGLELVLRTPMTEFKNTQINLDSIDKEYVGLYSALVFKKQ
ncbi:unnamed protein product [Sphagnum jensenii]|uniref:mRNA (guanine-N(7))-methyltransferase n=1 Tax=Sphagnum jensenii TaxID=128206 RepID=A0ABP0VEP1_9BRYO